MSSMVRLTVSNNDMEDTTYYFDHSRQCQVGRAVDCEIQVPSTAENRDVSRHHCVLDIEPPQVWVRDLGSKNGTFVNDQLIDSFPEGDATELRDGDEVRIGHCHIRVRMAEAPEMERELVSADAIPEMGESKSFFH